MKLSANIEHIFDYLIIEENGILKIKQEDIDQKTSAFILTITNDVVSERDSVRYFEDKELDIGRGCDGTQVGGGGCYGRCGRSASPELVKIWINAWMKYMEKEVNNMVLRHLILLIMVQVEAMLVLQNEAMDEVAFYY